MREKRAGRMKGEVVTKRQPIGALKVERNVKEMGMG